MDLALARLHAKGAMLREDDIERLSPLGHEHVNLLGRYHFSLAESVACGKLRPLRDAADADDQATLA